MSERLRAVLGSIVFLFVAPGIVAGVIPWLISQWRFLPPLFGLEPLRWVGGLLLVLGGVLLIETFSRFALQGLGTPAPIAPTKTLVVTGSYRFVRNPMYVAVVSLILGQGLFFGSVPVLVYGLAVWLGFHLLFWPTKNRRYATNLAMSTKTSAPMSGVGGQGSHLGVSHENQ